MKIVVKIGTSTLTYENGQLNLDMMERISRQISNLQNRGDKVVLVTSGAIGAGMGKLKITKRPKTLPQKQSLAAIGQGLLIGLYEKFFNEYGKTTAQLLLTKDDFSIRDRYLNISYTLSNLLKYNVVPIINENDTVTVDEIKIGDNDTLSALVASIIEADLLVILTDIDGLYDKNPKECDAGLIDVVDEFSDKLFEIAGGTCTNLGTGGMYTKIQAAKICYNSGVKMIIANGKIDNVLNRIASGEKIGTLFKPAQNPISSRKVWIAFNANLTGKLVIDDGAKQAILNKGKSLLASGVLSTTGEYSVGDCVSIVDTDDREIARGLINYTSFEINKIKGSKSSDIEKILGYKNYDEVVHRDNLVVIS